MHRVQKIQHSSHTGSRKGDFLRNVKFGNPKNPENDFFLRLFQQKQVGLSYFPYNLKPMGPYETDKHQHFHCPVGT